MIAVCDERHSCLSGVESFVSLAHSALAVHKNHILNTERHDKLADGDTCRARTADYNLKVFYLLVYKLYCVYEACRNNDGRSVLVVMENGDIKLLLKTCLDLEATGCRNILKVDASE